MFYTERLMLRALDAEADTNTLMQWQNAFRADAPRPNTREDVKKFLNRLLERSDGLPFFILCERPQEMPSDLAPGDDLFVKDGKPRYPCIGVLNFHSPGFSYIKRDVGFGVAFDKAHQGAGYGTEILTWALDYSFFTLGLHRCYLGVIASNERAINCYKKVGYIQEGVQRSAYFRDGKWHDIIDMAILEDEWRAKRK